MGLFAAKNTERYAASNADRNAFLSFPKSYVTHNKALLAEGNAFLFFKKRPMSGIKRRFPAKEAPFAFPKKKKPANTKEKRSPNRGERFFVLAAARGAAEADEQGAVHFAHGRLRQGADALFQAALI